MTIWRDSNTKQNMKKERKTSVIVYLYLLLELVKKI